MRILVFSDSHLSDDFSEKKFKFLKKIINHADQVIINGDFWEGYTISFRQFLESPYKHLFPLLKAKKTIYVHGNHDQKKFNNKKYCIFSNKQVESYSHKFNGKELVFEHGDRYVPSLTQLMKVSKPPASIVKFNDRLERIATKKLGSQFFKKFLGKTNKLLIKKLQNKRKANQIFITGHTHCAEANEQNMYYNSGFIKHGLGQYILIENNRIKLREEWYDC